MISGKVVVTYKRKRISKKELLNNSTEEQKVENHRKDSEVCVELSAGNNDSFHHPSHDSSEDVPEAKRQCFGKSDVKVGERSPEGTSIKDSYAEEKSDVPETKRLCSEKSNTKEIEMALCSLLPEIPQEKSDVLKENNLCSEKFNMEEMALEKSPEDNGCENNPLSDEKTVEEQVGPCICIGSSPEVEHKCSEKISVISEGADLALENKTHAIGEKKLGSSLITFRRRSKRVKDFNGADREENLQGEKTSTLVEPSHSDLSLNDTCHSNSKAQENIPSQNVDFTPSPENKGKLNIATQKEEHVLSDNPSVTEGPVCTVALKTELLPISINDKSQSPSNLGPDGLEIKGCPVSSGPISISPRDSHFVVDCNIALEPEPEQECLPINPIDQKVNDCAKFTEMTPKKNCLQLFPEYTSNIMPPIQNKQQKPYQERKATWNTSKPPLTRSSLFWPNIGSHSKEYVQENQTSSLLRHQMMLDNIVNRAKSMDGHRFRSPDMWLEEELDSLWVGVRRHGKGNWENMLRDPSLQFFSWRTPLDLSDRWQEEIRKLLEPSSVSEMNCFRTTDLLLLDRLNGLFRSKIGKENPNSNDDFQLSLGEVYSQPIFQKPVSNMGVYSSFSSRKGNPMFNKAMFACKASPNPDQISRGYLGNLPPWLKEAVTIPSMASSITGSSTQPYLQSNGAYDFSRTEQQMNGRSRVDFSSIKRDGNNDDNKQQDLIIIDSDASSEETISDDHSVRP